MSAILRLLLAACLGLTAAALNAWLLAKPGQSVVAVSRDVTPGTALKSSDLTSLSLGGDGEALRKVCVPWEDRALLEGVVAPRSLRSGDVVLQRDLREAFAVAERRLDLVKFRVIAVGSRFKQSGGEDLASRSTGRENTVTVAVKAVEGPPSADDSREKRDARRLLGIVARGTDQGSAAPEDRILGVAVFPPKSDGGGGGEGSGSGTMELKPDEMAVTVLLDAVESVPEVILVGGEIGFFLGPEFP